MSAPGPKPPEGLGKAGMALWGAVMADYELRVDELVLLEGAARTADTLGRLDDALVGAPLTVPGSMGQIREHPLLAEARQQRAALARLLRQLELERDAPVGVVGARSAAGRALAAQRWSRPVVA